MKYVPKAITRAVGRTALHAQQKSPTILFVVGLGGAVTATVLACKATLKSQDILEHAQKDIIDSDILLSRKELSQDEALKMRRHISVNTALELSKLYAPSVIVGGVSIVCLTQSHRILTQRHAALMGAYASLQTFLEGYRGRVREEIGEDREKDIYYASTPVELVEDDGKNGTKKIYGSTPGMPGPYAVYFDSDNLNFQTATEYNIAYVRIQETAMTDKLRSQGHLFLNEVYERLGIKPTQTGQVCGWFIGEERSDDFVEIKIERIHDLEGTLLLDFNVAGNVLKMLDENGKTNRLGRRR